MTAAAQSRAAAAAIRRFWRVNVALIVAVLTVSAAVSFGPPLFARWLDAFRFAGMPLPFAVGAQGAILIYVVLVVTYAVAMARADERVRRTRARGRGFPKMPSR